jgi:hypothetical protein
MARLHGLWPLLLVLTSCGVPAPTLLPIATSPPVCSPAPKTGTERLRLDRLQFQPVLGDYVLVGCLTNYTSSSLTSTFTSFNGSVVDLGQMVRLRYTYFQQKKIVTATGGIKFKDVLPGQATPFKLHVLLPENIITERLNLVDLRWGPSDQEESQTVPLTLAAKRDSPSNTRTSEPTSCVPPPTPMQPVDLTQLSYWQDFDGALFLKGCLTNHTPNPITSARMVLQSIPDLPANVIIGAKQAKVTLPTVAPGETAAFQVPLWDTAAPQINITKLNWNDSKLPENSEVLLIPVARY